MIVEVQLSSRMYFSPGLACRIIRKFPDGSRQMLKFGEDATREWVLVDDLIPGSVGYTMAFEDDEAKMLLEELLKTYQGATDMHTVRSDLMHERGRVDKLMDHLMGTATTAVDGLVDG